MDEMNLYRFPSKNNILYTCDVYEDKRLLKKLLNNHGTILTSAIREGNLDIIDMLVDIDATLSKLSLSKKQKERIKYFMQGYTETDISKMSHISRQTVVGNIDSVCNKLSAALTGAEL